MCSWTDGDWSGTDGTPSRTARGTLPPARTRGAFVVVMPCSRTRQPRGPDAWRSPGQKGPGGSATPSSTRLSPRGWARQFGSGRSSTFPTKTKGRCRSSAPRRSGGAPRGGACRQTRAVCGSTWWSTPTNPLSKSAGSGGTSRSDRQCCVWSSGCHGAGRSTSIRTERSLTAAGWLSWPQSARCPLRFTADVVAPATIALGDVVDVC